MFRAGAQVLWRVDGIAAKRGAACQTQRGSSRSREPTRRNPHGLGNDRFRLVRVDDHSDCLHHDPAGLFDGGGEQHLMTRRDSRPRGRTDAARRDADVIEANAPQLAVIRSPDLSPVPARLRRRWPEWPEPRPGTGAGGPGRGISESRGDDSARQICDKDRECTIWLYELLSGGSRSALRAFRGSLLPTSTHASVEEDVLYSCFRGLPLTAA
jgi:hypothetical protein